MEQESQYTEEDFGMAAAHRSVANAIKWGIEDGVEIEIIVYAMIHLKNHPEISIPEAIDHGIGEWLK